VSVETLALLVVFSPMVGAIIAGLFGRVLPQKVSMAVTTGLLFVAFFSAATIFYGHWSKTIELPNH